MQTPAPTLLESFASYVPRILLRWFGANRGLLTHPAERRLQAPLLLADLSGFTQLTDTLTREQPDGMEQLTILLNSYFGNQIDLVLAHGGDIVEFTGDGLIALWDATEYDPAPPPDHLIAHACQAALAIQHALAAELVTQGIHLKLRLSIGFGDLLVVSVGGVLGRWELLVAGDALTQASHAKLYAAPGEVVLSATAWQYLPTVARGTPTAAGVLRLDWLTSPPAASPPPLPLEPAMLPLIRGHIPAAVLRRVQAGQGDWLAELRYLSVIFVRVQGLNYTAPDALAQAHTVMRALQAALYQHEGSVNQFIVDDKGTVLVAALGLPPLTHTNEAVLAVQAATAMGQRLAALGYQSAAGIATGMVFCGTRGNQHRRDYAIIGDVMNLAARLMQLAASLPTDDSTPPVLCDTATYEAAHQQISFEALAPQTLKGKPEPVALFRPRAVIIQSQSQPPPLVGRISEQTYLHTLLHRLLHAQQGSVIILEGDIGMGKSHLLHHLLAYAREHATVTLRGAGDALAHPAPFHAWRAVFVQLFHLDLLPEDPATRRAHVLGSLTVAPGLREFAPLLQVVLPLELPDTATTARLTPQDRREQTHALLLRLLQLAATHLPLVLVLEDAHWLDPDSWRLAWAAVESIPRLLLLISTQPTDTPPAREYHLLLRHPQTHRLLLSGLDRAAVRQLLCGELDVSEIDEALLNLISEHAEGNPLFTIELTRSLHERGMIICEGQHARLAPAAPAQIRLPTSVQSVITSRIDRLAPALQLTVKVASVLGLRFRTAAIQAIFPLFDQRGAIPEYLHQLEQARIFVRTDPDGNGWTFTHLLIREAVYATLLHAQRREIEAAIDAWQATTTGAETPHT